MMRGMMCGMMCGVMVRGVDRSRVRMHRRGYDPVIEAFQDEPGFPLGPSLALVGGHDSSPLFRFRSDWPSGRGQSLLGPRRGPTPQVRSVETARTLVSAPSQAKLPMETGSHARETRP